MFRELEGLFESPEDAPPSRLAMLRGYFDESGHQSTEWVCVAGFVGTSEQWSAFVPKWKAALGQRPTLHMRRLRWKQDRTRQLLARLGPIPHACGLHGARGVVRVSDYADLVDGTGDQRLYKGYLACLMPMVSMILKGIPADERIEFVFDHQNEYEWFVDQTMTIHTKRSTVEPWRFTNTGKPKIARWAFAPKGSTILTDPADYLAFAVRELHADPKSKKSRWCRPILGEGKTRGYGMTLSRDLVRSIVRGAQTLNEEQGLS